jgi:hypothetical protein
MEIIFNNATYATPADLSEVTLIQAIQLKSSIKAVKQEDTIMKAAILINLFTGIDVEAVKTQMDIAQVVVVYMVWHSMMEYSEEYIKPKASYVWNGETWYLGSPASLFSQDIMKHEFSLLKELSKAIICFSNGDWSVMPIICAAYLRRQDEELQMDIFTDPLCEKVKLMDGLPMDIVIGIGKFLKETLDIFNAINIKTDV